MVEAAQPSLAPLAAFGVFLHRPDNAAERERPEQDGLDTLD
jgi:hypothetical protein